MTNEQLGKYLETKAADIGEHFTDVQILASYTDEAGTHFVRRGYGNWFARQGMAQEFIQAQNAEVMAHVLHRDAGDQSAE